MVTKLNLKLDLPMSILWGICRVLIRGSSCSWIVGYVGKFWVSYLNSFFLFFPLSPTALFWSEEATRELNAEGKKKDTFKLKIYLGVYDYSVLWNIFLNQLKQLRLPDKPLRYSNYNTILSVTHPFHFEINFLFTFHIDLHFTAKRH